MFFHDIIGQQEIKSRLIQTVLDNRISHAQLFIGQEGYGMLPLAIAYAQYICCQGRTPVDSCGECPSCRKYAKLVHPDLHFVFPVVRTTKFTKPISDDFIAEWREALLQTNYLTSKLWLEKIGEENNQGGIYAHESQEIIRKLNLKTFESEYKIMIIWMPEKMNISASNKLLKMIEEPPPKTLFILITANEGQIIRTIVSRNQLIKVPRIDNESMYAELVRRYGENEDLRNVVRIANGNFNKAIDILEVEESYTFYLDLFIDLMRNSYAKNVMNLIEWVEKMAKIGRESQKNFLIYGIRLVRECFILGTAQESIVFLAEKEAAFANKFFPFIKSSNIGAITEELSSAHYHIERNGYDKIVFMDLALKMINLVKN